MSGPPFYVLRRCPPEDCETGCNCDRVEVLVDVDELTELEQLRVLGSGSEPQRAELGAWLAV